jgi:hypothetical protein
MNYQDKQMIGTSFALVSVITLAGGVMLIDIHSRSMSILFIFATLMSIVSVIFVLQRK